MPAIEMIYHSNNCVIFVKHNYNLNIPAVANALSKWYWEIRWKEFICKSCHKEIKDGKYSKNVQNCPNCDMFGSNVNDNQNDQHNVQEQTIYNEKQYHIWFPSKLYITEYHFDKLLFVYHVAIKLIYHDHNVSYSKNQKYNYDNSIIVEALSHRFSVPTSQEHICKKCDKDLLEEIMPMNSVASQIWINL